MIALDNNNYNLERDIKVIEKNTYSMNGYLTALTQISSLTYLTSLSTLTAYATEINEIENSIYSLTTDLNNYLLSSETSSLTFNSSVLSLSDYLKSSETSSLTCEWKNIPTSTLNNYLLSSETSSLTFNSSVLSLSDYVKTSDTGAFTSPWDTILTSTLNNYLLSSNYVSFDSSVLSSYLLSSDYVSFDSSVLSSYLLTSDYVSFDTSVLNAYLLSSKTTDFAGSSVATLSTLSSLSSLSTLSNTPYMINAESTNPNLYLYNVSNMPFFNNGTIMGNYSMGGIVQREGANVWMNSYDHVLTLDKMTDCNFHFEYSDTSYNWSYTNRRIGFNVRSLYRNTFETLSSLSGYILSSNKISRVNKLEAEFAYSNTFWGINNMNVQRLLTNTFSSYVTNVSFITGSGNNFTNVDNIQGAVAESCTFSDCGSIAIHYRASKCSFTVSIGELYIKSATSCSGYANNCTIYRAEKNKLTARSFTIGSASSCTFQTCDSINFIALYAPQLWAPHYLKGGTISGGSITGDNLVMDVGYIDGLKFEHVCRGTISFTTMGNPFTIASAAYPQDIVVSCNLHPYQWSTKTIYFSLSADLQSSFTLHVYNIENIRPSFQSAYISQYLCLDVLGPRGVFSNGSYSYASLAQYCPTSRLSYNGVPWAAILH
ncbi:MAG: hypothetical protein VZR33_03995 [Methanosphaera sp.]|nr:hypothetical protein [Methanosphaera sp.]